MSNVVSIFEHKNKKKEDTAAVPQSIKQPIEALIDWAESNGIDPHNNVMFQVRLADFLSLLQTEIAKKQAAG